MNKNAEVKKEVENNKPDIKKEIEQLPPEITPEEMEQLLKIEPFEEHCFTGVGYWVTERSGFTQKSHCSHCGAAAMAIRGSNDETLTPFCPMCGYIMK